MKLKPFDVLLYRNQGTIGKLIAWGEWVGKSGEATEYSHVGLVYATTDQSFEMNPPAARVFPIDQVPFDRVDVWRLAVNGVDVFDDPDSVAASKAMADKMIGEPYDYGFIGKAFGASLLARIGLTSAASWVMKSTQSTQHRAVCSNTAECVIKPGLWVKHPDFRLEPESVGDGDMEPSDWPLVAGLYRIPPS